MFEWLLSTEGFVPRKSCGAWDAPLIFLHTASDIAIWLAYLTIPCALVYFAGQRGLGKLNRLVWLFAAFIVCCGFTHFIEALLFEKPVYHLSGAMKALTAVVSWVTVLALIPSIPTILSAFNRMAEPSREMPTLGELSRASGEELPRHSAEKWIVAMLAATLAVLVRGLFEPIMAGNHAFFIPLLAVVFVSWRNGFWPGILTVVVSMVTVTYFFVEPKNSFRIDSIADQLAVGLFFFAGVACAVLGESKLANSRKAAKHLRQAQHNQRESEEWAQRLRVSQHETSATLAQLETFVQHAPIGMAFFDDRLQVVRINAALAGVYGVDIAKLEGQKLDDFATPTGRAARDDATAVLEAGQPVTDRLMTGAAGSAQADRVWESSYYPVRQADGQLFGVGVVAREITQRLRDQLAIHESEKRFRNLAEAMPQIVWVTAPDGRTEYFNPVWYRYTGQTPEQSLGDGWLEAIHPDDRAPTHARWSAATASGEPYEVLYRFRQRDGEYRWFLGRGLPQRGDDGAIASWFGTCTDIDDAKRDEERLRDSERELRAARTELESRVKLRTIELSDAIAALRDEVDYRRKAEEKVEASAVELRRSNAELEQFAYVASHDLQEPLRKIQAFGDRLKLKSAPALGTDGADHLERILNSAARMRQLINDLLAYSRLSNRPRSFAPVDLTAIAVGALSDLEIRIQQSGATVEIGPLPTIDADPLQMRQLFQNLLSNALKFAKSGQKPIVVISAEDTGADPAVCRLRFRDNGIGFDVKYLDRIFQVFQRLHGRAEYEGTGVGLAICHKIVHLHAGDITAESSPGHGSTFIVTFPRKQTPILSTPD